MSEEGKMNRHKKLDKLWGKVCQLQGEGWVDAERRWVGLVRALNNFDRAMRILGATVDASLQEEPATGDTN